jgi:hypothetical protein
VPGLGEGAVDVELVDDEVRLEPPACAREHEGRGGVCVLGGGAGGASWAMMVVYHHVQATPTPTEKTPWQDIRLSSGAPGQHVISWPARPSLEQCHHHQLPGRSRAATTRPGLFHPAWTLPSPLPPLPSPLLSF